MMMGLLFEIISLLLLCARTTLFRAIMCVLAFLSTDDTMLWGFLCGVFFGRPLFIRAFKGDFLLRGFFPLPIGQKEEWDANSNRTHNALLRSSEEHEKRTLSVLHTKAFRNTKARQSPKRKRLWGRPKAKIFIIMAFYRKNQIQKKDLFYIYNMFRV